VTSLVVQCRLAEGSGVLGLCGLISFSISAVIALMNFSDVVCTTGWTGALDKASAFTFSTPRVFYTHYRKLRGSHMRH
jgi:hypothetical protein